jgi:hypothetical protein
MKYTIIIGNPVDGFSSIGIFDSSEDAVAYGDMQRLFHDYSIMEIEEIEKPKTATRNEMIHALIDKELKKWSSDDQKTALLCSMLAHGYAGLEKFSDEEIVERYNKL